MAFTHNPYRCKYRGSAVDHRDSIPEHLRGAPIGRDARLHEAVPTTFIDTEAAFVDTDGEQPPMLPYPSEFCSANTFDSGDCGLNSQDLRKKITDILVQDISVDITASSNWAFTGTFYPEESRTVFNVSIFANSGKKNACLIEMQLEEGERVAFQGLCSYVQSQIGLAYAFADQWDFDGDESEEDSDKEWENGYQHRSFAPLPLPPSLLSSPSSPSCDTDDEDALNAYGNDSTRGNDGLVDVLLMNACSPFADVRRTGWQQLAKATNDSVVAAALLKARVDGEVASELAATILKQDATTDSVISDTQRCVLKTLLNVAEKTANGCVCICKLKTQIIEFAGKTKPLEIRRTAIKLMELMKCNPKASAIDCTRSHDKCRVSSEAVDLDLTRIAIM